MTLIVIAIKWMTMGRYEPQVKPMWSFWAMRTEAVAVLYWGLAGRVFLDHLRGTPFLPWMLRLFGSKFGKGVWMDATDITEFDCVTVGDYAAINMMSVLQTHLYEDRVMKIGRINVGTRRHDRRGHHGALRHALRRVLAPRPAHRADEGRVAAAAFRMGRRAGGAEGARSTPASRAPVRGLGSGAACTGV